MHIKPATTEIKTINRIKSFGLLPECGEQNDRIVMLQNENTSKFSKNNYKMINTTKSTKRLKRGSNKKKQRGTIIYIILSIH